MFGRSLNRDNRTDAELLKEALETANKADVIVAALGESSEMSGESSSRTDLNLPDVQQTLLKELVATGKPGVLVLFTGRPLILNWEQDNVPAGEQMEFEFHGRKYRLRASGVNTGDQPEGDESSWDTVKNYKLYLSEAGSGNEQLLIAMPGFWDTKALILWIGDLDADAKPDFVFDVSDDYESKCVVLFLSSKADESQIVKCVGRSYYAFDC